ncbi:MULTISPECIES: hypothetical protein [Streptomyces]|uniref:MAE-28990/MAE-18760-like HEPN domain-containing protein n=1 Tax=Streptomyces clavifer TaxID=68188 RepID=A0ABS4V803_9ACTN|nr:MULTISPECIES: hypothetical protein [Streptomyces]MBP2359972.1 hypothetical protein [Streptomyces clavifer]MDX2747837.1 hypothetical protein [Streptomyces sp. NRRL_B-2557]
MDRQRRNSAHRRNLDALETAFEVTSRSCKEAIRRGNSHEVDSLTKASALILAATLEDRLMVLVTSLYFPQDAEKRVMSERSIAQKWQRAVDEAFSARYGVPLRSIPARLDFTAQAYHKGISGVLDEWISPLFSVRNSLAHGQWVVAFNENRDAVNNDKTKNLKNLNLWRLRLLKNMLGHLERLVFDLMVTQYAFERDFDTHWSGLEAARRRIENGKPGLDPES